MRSMRYLIGGGLVLAGIAAVICSANVSYYGYELALPGLPYAGILGCVFAAFAYLMGLAVPQTLQLDDRQWFFGAVGLLVIFCVVDIYGNDRGTAGDIEHQIALATAHNAAFNVSTTAIETAETELASVNVDQAVMIGDDVTAKQTIMLAAGFYMGSVDGLKGSKTESAVREYGAFLRDRKGELEALVKQHQPIVAKGSVDVPGQAERYQALAIAIALTILPMLAGMIGSAIMRPRNLQDAYIHQLERTVSAVDTVNQFTAMLEAELDELEQESVTDNVEFLEDWVGRRVG